MDITREHPEYVTRRTIFRTFQDLYVGGEHIKRNGRYYLETRRKEPYEIYEERLGRVFYENYIGSIIDWYSATLFRREAVLSFEAEHDMVRRFYSAFTEDCDRRGTTLSAMLRQQFVAALVQGRSYLLLDFPKVEGRPITRADEDRMGVSRAYLVDYAADELINWSLDEHGQYEWVVLRTKQRRLVDADLGQWCDETRWTVYDKRGYLQYRQLEGSGDARPVLVAEGTHSLANIERVPLFELKIPDGLWLMNKAAHLQLEHFNKSNALAWALSMGLFAMPVVYSDREWDQIVGESYYLQLGPEDSFGWTEPDGGVYQIAAENLARLQEEIYRVCYLLHQSRGLHSSGPSQSGLSKQRDFAITQEVLRVYGDIVKDYTKRVLRAVAQARLDEVSIDVSGMDDFDIGEFSTDLADAERLLNLGMGSPTLRATVFKKLAAKYLCDVRQEIKDRINDEIDEAQSNQRR